ncbi:hypothetical protein FNF31_02079 [Cafeteria roenbergensis]|uniref:VPS9 domain-containing protein n=1 Tax=Cafeteria roenbergensis TaxID=33653 RepID=A0A5A8DI57_CAFRO|nr:hypothetical protein FNF31_02079 [Cafeteria roenbergensis]KAA0170167.1 hypothetical protein FNF28_01588 [Cafeteria roenbergensis]
MNAAGPGWAAGGAPDAAKPAPVPPPFRSRARSAAAASTSGAGAAAINHGSAAAAAADASLGASVASFLDHSLGASLAKFALVFGKLHPVREQGASAVVRWPVPVKRRPAGAAGGEGWFTRGWGSSPGRGKTGDEVVIPPTPARPPCLYAPHQCPWGHEAFADDEALFERRPPPESVAFALAFQDLRTFAWLLGLEIAQWYPEVVPPVPPARAELPEGTSLDEAQARQYDAARSRAFREAQEWREFVFECSLDAASILCYEPCLNLCMDRWGDRDNTLMHCLLYVSDADPALFHVPPKSRLDGEPLPPKEGPAPEPSRTRRERGEIAEEAYKEAITLLRSMTLQRTARHKCAVVARVMGSLSDAARRVRGQALGSDDLMPLLAWALARSRQPALLAQLGFVQALLPERLMTQSDGFTVAALSGAVHAMQDVARASAAGEEV